MFKAIFLKIIWLKKIFKNVALNVFLENWRKPVSSKAKGIFP